MWENMLAGRQVPQGWQVPKGWQVLKCSSVVHGFHVHVFSSQAGDRIVKRPSALVCCPAERLEIPQYVLQQQPVLVFADAAKRLSQLGQVFVC